MIPNKRHSWNLTPADAIHLQNEIRDQFHLSWEHPTVRCIGGADVSYVRRLNRAFAVIVLFEVTGNIPNLQLKRTQMYSASMEISYPYIPGLLSFREGPALERVWNKIKNKPDLLIFDGAGIAHPRRCGLATHLGWRWDVPALGCAKSRLIGAHEEINPGKGSCVPLYEKRTRIGTVVRSRTRIKPLYVSPGYLMDFEAAENWTLHTVTKYRMPEPTRIADRETRELRKEYEHHH